MKVTIDTEAKTIEIEGQHSFNEIEKALKGLLGKDWKEYKVGFQPVSITVSPWDVQTVPLTQPIPYNPYPYNPYPHNTDPSYAPPWTIVCEAGNEIYMQ